AGLVLELRGRAVAVTLVKSEAWMRARLGLVVALALGVGAAGGVGGCYDFGSLHGGSVDAPPADAGGGGDGAPADAADGGTCAGCWDGTLCRQGTALAPCGLGGAMC